MPTRRHFLHTALGFAALPQFTRAAAPAGISLGFSQSELASIVGATRPKVNRALQDILATGAIRRDGDALVCDVPALLDLAAMQDELD